MRPLRRRAGLSLSLALLGCLGLSRLDGEESGAPEPRRFYTTRTSEVALDLPAEEDAFVFAVFGDRTGGPPEGIEVLKEVVREVDLIEPDLVMTVGDLVQGYNQTPAWLVQMREYKSVMGELDCPWFPVAGNHDVYWRGPQGMAPPPGEHESNYEEHFGPLWYAFEHKGSWFIVLYSDEGDPQTGRKGFQEPASQRMSDAQFAFLEQALVEAQGAEHVFLFLHHPRWLEGGYGDDWRRVHARLVEAGNVSAVFAGHIHRMRYDGARDGIEYFTLATVGGGQSGVVPDAGYLHHYELVTVRDGEIDVVSYPVGSAQDPRAITGQVSDATRLVAERIAPRFEGAARLAPDGSMAGALALEIPNPAQRPLEVELVPASEDSRWRFSCDRLHALIEPGERARFELEVRRAPGALDADWRVPELALSADYLADGWRVPIPERRFGLPLDAAGLSAPPVPARESALALDGQRGHLRVRDAQLELPDGPFTLECWVAADEYRERQGVVCKTEGSEYGIFANGGAPEFLVHLGGGYVEASASGPVLEPGRWHHLAGVSDGASVRLYVDGVLQAATPASGARTPNALPLVIGGDVDGAGRPASTLKGRIDEVRLSSVARYSGERFEPERRLARDQDTALLLHMDALQGPWIHDDSGGGRHADALGGATVVPAAGD